MTGKDRQENGRTMSGILSQMPSLTATQGVNSKTFKAPWQFKDPFMAVSDVYEWHAVHSEDHPFFVYFDEASGTKVTIRWAEAVKIVHFIANSVLASVRQRSVNDASRPLVALYSSSDTLGYILSYVGILRAGFPVFLISSRIAPAALKHLIQKSGVTHIFVGDHDAVLSQNLLDVKQALGADFTVHRIPSWIDADVLSSDVPVHRPPLIKHDPNSLCTILHSSGSTALPELNYWTHKMAISALWQPWYGERNICGKVMSTPSIPMAGAAGVMQAFFPASSGIVISGFKPAAQPTVPSPQNVWKSMILTGSDYAFVLQPFLCMWSEESHKVIALAGLDGVMFGGGPLAREVGDKLATKGVEIFTFFGSSEAGCVNRIFPRKMGLNWEWFTFCPLVSPSFRQMIGPDEKNVELVLKNCPTHKPTRFNMESESPDGVSLSPAYATGDLIEAHPTMPGFWRFVCRISDQETMGLGPKVNVVVLARLLMQDPLIGGAVLFSHTVGPSLICGVIIEPEHSTSSNRLRVKTPKALDHEAYQDLIWPALERYNDLAPDGCRLTKEWVIIASKGKPFVYGEKGMPRRKEVIALYQDEIQRMV